MDKLNFHLIDIKTGKTDPEVVFSAERDDNGHFHTVADDKD